MVLYMSRNMQLEIQLILLINWECLPQWSRGLKRRSTAARPLRLWVRIPPGAWMFVSCECCVLSGRGLWDGLITRPVESYRLWRVVVCDQETSRMRRLKPATGPWKIRVQPQGCEAKKSNKQPTLNWELCTSCITTRVGTLIVATIYLQLIQNRYMFRSFTVLQCSHQHCVQPVSSDVEVVGYL